MTDTATSAIVLAGGIGSRFHSKVPKVVHPLLGKPMLSWIVEACMGAAIDDIVVVVSPSTEDAIQSELPEIRTVVQPQANGTGDAAEYGMSGISGEGMVVVASGDTPCMTTKTIKQLMNVADAQTIAVLSCKVDDPTGYGRILRNDKGEVDRIVEQRDASAKEQEIQEINAGLYVFPKTLLRKYLPDLSTDNAQGEKYLVDLIDCGKADGIPTVPVVLDDESEIQGVNDRVQLEAAAQTLRMRIIQDWQRQGVTIEHAETVDIEATVQIAKDVVIGPQVRLSGATSIGEDSVIRQGCVLHDTVVGQNCDIKPYVVAEKVQLAAGVSAGPFAHLRPGTKLGTDSKIGNFVETKNTSLGQNSKANHLAYLGDATIGRDVNVGAGTITCNYDGINKHQTVLEDDVHIGSDTQLVAPVTVGKGATVGAGSTISKDVPPGVLAVSRVPQKHIEGYPHKRKPKTTKS